MKEFTEADIDAMVAEVQEQLLSPLIKSAQEDLAKSAGKQHPVAKEGGNGTKPEVAKNVAKSDEMEKSAGLPTANRKSAPPMAKEASDEKSAAPAPSDSGSDSAAPSDSGSDSAPSSPESDGPPPPADGASPDGAPQDPSMQGGGEATLEQQYGQLSDEDLQMHFQALKATLMGRMGGAGPAGAPGMDGSAGPSAAGPAGPSAGPVQPPAAPSAPPAPIADPSMGAVPPPPDAAKAMPLAMSEKDSNEDLKKHISKLEADFSKVVNILESVLGAPSRKAVTSMHEFVAKSENEKPVAKKLSKSEILVKLNKITKEPSLKKTERDSIDRYVLLGDEQALKDIAHLLS